MIRGGIRRLAAVRRHRFRLKSVPPVSITAEEATPLLWENTENGYTFLCGSLDTACGWCPPPGRLVWGAGTPSSAPHPSLSCSGPRLPSFTRPYKHVRRGSASVSCCPIFSRLEISRSFQSPFRRSLDVLLRPVGPWQTDRKTRPRPFDHVSIGLALPTWRPGPFVDLPQGDPVGNKAPSSPFSPNTKEAVSGHHGSIPFPPWKSVRSRPTVSVGGGRGSDRPSTAPAPTDGSRDTGSDGGSLEAREGPRIDTAGRRTIGGSRSKESGRRGRNHPRVGTNGAYLPRGKTRKDPLDPFPMCN